MERNKTTFETNNKYDIQAYYGDLIVKYNPDNTVIEVVKAISNKQFVREVIRMISRLINVPVDAIEDEYREEIDLYWEKQGGYLVQCTNYGLLSDVVISIEKI